MPRHPIRNFQGEPPESLADARELLLRPSSTILSLSSADVHVLDEGSANSESVVVLLGSQWLSAFSFDRFREALGATIRVIRVDLPGHGLSGRFRHNSYTAADYADLTDAIISAFSLRSYILVGSSHTGIPAALHASRKPKGLRGLVLATTSGLKRPNQKPINVPMRPMHPAPSAESKRTMDFYRWKLATLLCREMEAPEFESLTREVMWLNELPGRDKETHLRLRAYRSGILERILPEIFVPVLIQWSDQSTYLPKSLAAQATGLVSGSATFTIHPNTGHLLLLDAPDDTAAQIRKFALPYY